MKQIIIQTEDENIHNAIMKYFIEDYCNDSQGTMYNSILMDIGIRTDVVIDIQNDIINIIDYKGD